MNVEVDEARRDDQASAVNLRDFGFQISEFGWFRDATIDNEQVANFVAAVCGIDDAAAFEESGFGGQSEMERASQRSVSCLRNSFSASVR